jgi:Asp-tRNA(Asn)/Glu-tRNA(Gln) amidotransferase A subunit family amidase
VQRLLDAGAQFVGKAHTDELAFSMNGRNAHFGTPRNGGAPDRIPGGSSSGSASAVSNGLCDFALGSDTGGSVRTPASHCGLFGIRPTHGRISLERVLDLAPSFDTCGFFTRIPRPSSESRRSCSAKTRRHFRTNHVSCSRRTPSRWSTRRFAGRSRRSCRRSRGCSDRPTWWKRRSPDSSRSTGRSATYRGARLGRSMAP